MGADIHLYIEYDDDGAIPFSDIQMIRGFSDGDFLIPRDYHLFATLAGVRSRNVFQPKYSPRGMPEVASPEVINRFFRNILDEEGERLEEDDVTRAQAEEWVAKGHSYIRDSWIKKNGFVSDPDHHTPSWLTLKEISESFAASPYSLVDMPKESQAVHELLQSLEKYFGVDRARIVFWFDN